MSQKDKTPYIMQIDSALWNTHALKTTPIEGGAPSACKQGPATLALTAHVIEIMRRASSPASPRLPQ